MVAFPESESMTIKRIEVALRNKDMYLLKEASYKLHEKYHTGYDFKMLDELKQIADYVKEHEIPSDISDILCSTIDEILTVAGHDVTEYKKEDEETNKENEQKEEAMKHYAYNFGDTTIDSLNSNTGNEEAEKENEDETQDDNGQQQLKLENENETEDGEETDDIVIRREEDGAEVIDIIKRHDIGKAEIEKDESYGVPEVVDIYEKNNEDEKETYTGKTEETHHGPITIFYGENVNGEVAEKIKHYRSKLNMLSGGLSQEFAMGLLDEVSDIMDKIDTDSYREISKFLIGLKDAKCKKTFITTSQNQNIFSTLTKADVKYQIPMVGNTYSDEAKYDCVPLFGTTNLFTCPKCGLKFMNLNSDFKALTLECPECGNISYPDIYDSTNPECNVVLWHRAFSTLIDSKVWILIKPATKKGNEALFDLWKLAFQKSLPESSYIYSNDSSLEDALYEINPKTNFLSSYESLGELLNDFLAKEGLNR